MRLRGKRVFAKASCNTDTATFYIFVQINTPIFPHYVYGYQVWEETGGSEVSRLGQAGVGPLGGER